ncbi:MAG: nucleoside triphosphate pyrophosphohydrolase [Erysipelotrichaceae bacterium]
MEKIYNKLVRDNIPDIILKDNHQPVTRILNNDDYKKELEKKLLEEYNEVLNTTTSEERIEELADMYEILTYLAQLENKTINDVIEVANNKKNKRGGFDKKIFLEKVIYDD